MSEISLQQALDSSNTESAEIINVDAPSIKVLIFTLGGQLFAAKSTYITEILVKQKIYFVPACPDTILGVINVRGAIESVIDLARIVSIQPSLSAADGSLLLARGNNINSAIQIDTVADVLDILEENIQPVPASLDKNLRQYAGGVFQFKDQPVTLIDIDKLFAEYAKSDS